MPSEVSQQHNLLYAGDPAEGNYPLEQLSHAFRLRSALSDPALRSPFEVHENTVAVSEYEHSRWNPTRASLFCQTSRR